ncbi:MAG: hypothetical protein ACO4AU_03180 [bacterium]|jgi:hypothetical protein
MRSIWGESQAALEAGALGEEEELEEEVSLLEDGVSLLEDGVSLLEDGVSLLELSVPVFLDSELAVSELELLFP